MSLFEYNIDVMHSEMPIQMRWKSQNLNKNTANFINTCLVLKSEWFSQFCSSFLDQSDAIEFNGLN